MSCFYLEKQKGDRKTVCMKSQYSIDICIGLFYLFISSAKFRIVNTYSKKITWNWKSKIYTQKFIFVLWSLRVLKIDFYVNECYCDYKFVKIISIYFSCFFFDCYFC